MDVYQNGVLLKPVTDYASTTGTSVVLVTGASTDDVVEMIVYDSFAVADTVSAANGGTFSGNVAMGGTLAVTDDVNIDSGTLFVDASTNRVGMGTTSPSTPLHISGTAAANNYQARITNTATDGYSTLQFFDDQAGIYRAGSGVSAYGGASALNILTVGSHAVTLGTSNTVRVNVSGDGEVTMPTQPAFMAGPSSTQSNMANDTTIILDTELFDVGSNFASNTFTAPITGKYQLNASIRLASVDSASGYVYVQIETSNRSYYNVLHPNFSGDLLYLNLSISILADMDASDTAVMKFGYSGGTQQVDTSGAGGTLFSGALIC
jgi:hypothetical protein